MSVLASLNENYCLKQKIEVATRIKVSLVCIWLLCFVFSRVNTNILKYLKGFREMSVNFLFQSDAAI